LLAWVGFLVALMVTAGIGWVIPGRDQEVGEWCSIEIGPGRFDARLVSCTAGVPVARVWVERDRWGVRVLSLDCPHRMVMLPGGCGVVRYRLVSLPGSSSP
jgi:hypothetical protein